MPLDIETVRRAMSDEGQAQIFFDEEGSEFAYLWSEDGQQWAVRVDVFDDRRYIRFRLENLVRIENLPDQLTLKILKQVLQTSNRLKALKFTGTVALDSDAFDISASVEIFVLDGAITGEQVLRAMALLCCTAMKERRRLLNLLQGGEYPDDESVADTCRRLVEGRVDDNSTNGPEPDTETLPSSNNPLIPPGKEPPSAPTSEYE